MGLAGKNVVIVGGPGSVGSALVAHGVSLEIADALDRQVEERLKGGIVSQVDVSTHQLFAVKPTTFLEFAQRNAAAFGGTATASRGLG